MTVNSSNYINKLATGYMVNMRFSASNRQKIVDIQQSLKGVMGDELWLQPSESLHITLLDWLAPLVDYGKNKDELFEQIYPSHKSGLLKALKQVESLELRFNSVQASAGAIYCKAADAKQINTIRQEFLKNVQLLPGTKMPPSIAHFTIARFVKEVTLSRVERNLSSLSIDISERVKGVRLVRETKLPMQEYQVKEEFKLGHRI